MTRTLTISAFACVAVAVAADFARDVQPILHARCIACHSGDRPQGGLSVLSREALLAGGLSGPAVKPGSSRDSLLIRRVTSAEGRMPLGKDALSTAEVAILSEWIDGGALWNKDEAAQTVDPRVRPRRPAIPPGVFANPIDAFVERYWRSNHVPPPRAATDAVFARRVYFDLIGLPPSPADLQNFVASREPRKRERLIQELLDRREAYADHWMTFWNDLLRNEHGVALPGEKREWITEWLLDALRRNMPYNAMAQALLNPVRPGAPRGFIAGVNWGGEASASQSPAMQAAQNSAQVFLGANLKCASCHDSFVSRWKLAQTFGLAAYFSAKPLEVSRCEAKTGVEAKPAFPFPELDAETPSSDPAERLAQAARMFTSDENGRFSRTVVNRYWKLLFGRGLIEPVDDMEASAWDSDVLDWLASDFVEHHYDLQHLLLRITTSQAYQAESFRESGSAHAFLFRGPLYRRLTAEQFCDALSAMTGEWKVYDDLSGTPGVPSRRWRFRSDPLTRALGRPERIQVVTERATEATTLQALEFINGNELRTLLRRAAQRLQGTYAEAPQSIFDSGQVRQKAVAVQADLHGAKRIWLVIADAGSYDRSKLLAGWIDAKFDGPAGAVEVRSEGTRRSIQMRGEGARDAIGGTVPFKLSVEVPTGYDRFTATVALDESSLRPEVTGKVRFFVFNEEPDINRLVRSAGEPPVPRPAPTAGEPLIRSLFQYALARDPAPAELADARSLSVEDLLWVLSMSPEFQYLR